MTGQKQHNRWASQRCVRAVLSSSVIERRGKVRLRDGIRDDPDVCPAKPSQPDQPRIVARDLISVPNSSL